MIFLFGFLNSLSVFIRVGVFLFGSLSISNWLHNLMITKVICAPINLFFDVTPIGKILNRFSKDITTVD